MAGGHWLNRCLANAVQDALEERVAVAEVTRVGGHLPDEPHEGVVERGRCPRDVDVLQVVARVVARLQGPEIPWREAAGHYCQAPSSSSDGAC